MPEEMIGKKFNHLLVLSLSGSINQRLYYKCLCDCGNEKIILGTSMRLKKSQSCGCLRIQRITKHNLLNSPEYKSWQGMRQRCENPNSDSFKNYGARGICVCKKWRTFNNFYLDMGRKPSPEYTIERLNNDGNYSKNNCVWATKKQQGRNKRNNHIIVFMGQTKCLAEWSELLDIAYPVLQQRLGKYGWSVWESFTTPVKKYAKNKIS